MSRKTILLLTVIFVLSLAAPLFADAYIIDDVPSYDWYHGCSPTAAGSVFGYWDVKGYSNLFDANGWENIRWTVNVQDQISSPAHNAKYDSDPDDPNLPTPPYTSIADFMYTSVDPRGYGGTYGSEIDDGFEDYAAYRGYDFVSWRVGFGSFSWNDFVAEIDAGCPMLFSVDSDGDGSVDHSVPVFGYDDRGVDGRWYGLYTTWHEAETVGWYEFQGTSSQYAWGVSSATYVNPITVIPEPSTVLMFLSGVFGFYTMRKRS
ncbi:MAG: PEP-CTERM sorting domain-containing protein [PVC group bacterium]|nr:PEP-CTERM sorting domain-containing protein [PVC group bacterium]